jgi:DNA-binding MarR family transcriptional regulator
MSTHLTECSDAGSPIPAANDLVQQVLKLSKTIRTLLVLRLAPIGLTVGLDEILLELEMGTGMTVSLLAEKLSLRASTVSTQVERLQEMGFVELIGNDRTPQRTIVQITWPGLEAKTAVKGIWIKIGGDLTSGMPSGEATSLAAQLENASQAISAHLIQMNGPD